MIRTAAKTLLLIAGICQPFALRGQDQRRDTLSSIVGQTYYRMEISVSGQADRMQAYDLPVAGSEVVLVAAGDTLRTKTDNLGKFTFKGIAARQVTLSMADDDYAPFSESFTLMPGENIVIVPRQQKTETLDAASVSAERPVMTMRGDTLVYHAAALTVGEGDYAIDLLAQMPGVEVDRTTGQIRISGKSVVRSYVNGALVFGLDPMASMENLRAQQVVEMEVYDEKDPQEVLDNIVREKQRVVNIKTRDPIFSTTDLQARAIGGADETLQEDGKRQYRYAAGTNAHFFSELIQMYADAVTNNVGMSSSNISAVPAPQTSYLRETDLDLGFNRYWVSPLYGNALNTRYLYTHQQTKSRRRTLQEYFEMPEIPAHMQEEEIASSRRVERHNVTTGFSYRTGRLGLLQWRQGFSLTRSASDGTNAGSTVYEGMNPMLRGETTYSGDKTWSLSEAVTVGFRGNGSKPGPSLSIAFSLRQNNLDAWNLDTLASSYSKRYLTKEGRGLQRSWNGALQQTFLDRREGLSQFQLTGVYGINYSHQTRTQEAFDLFGVDEPAANPANTFDFTNSTLTHTLSLQSRYANPDKMIRLISLALDLRMTRIKDRERLPASVSADRTYFDVLPVLSIQTRRFIWTLSPSSTLPSVEQLRRRIDDTRPLSLIAGNPDLKQSQTFHLEVRNNSLGLQARKWTTSWSANLQYGWNPLVQRTLFYREETVLDDYDGYRVPAGASLLRTENADYTLTGGLSLNASARLSLLKGSIKPTLTLQPKLDYRLQPQYFGQTLDRLTEWTPSVNTSMTIPFKPGTQASVKGSLAYVRALSQKGSMDRKALRGQLDADFSTEFLKYAFFTGVYSWRPVRDLSAPERNRDYHQLDLSLGVNLLRKDLKISLRGIDLLRSGSVYAIAMGPSSVTHTWTPLYGRYFVLDISYRFNNSGGKAMPRYGI